MQLQNGDSAAILDKMNDFAQLQTRQTAAQLPSAGSTFKRPWDTLRSQLIEQAGLKGHERRRGTGFEKRGIFSSTAAVQHAMTCCV